MLDIIIPAYKDPDGLRKTLQSVYFPDLEWLHITVVDDCSPIGYDDILINFPQVKYYRLSVNHGPGYARQYGISHTSESYFMFVDCGDLIVSKESLLMIKNTLEDYPYYYIFLWAWIAEKTGSISNQFKRSTQGWVYKRQFFNIFDVKFCTSKEGGYAHEDVGFNRTCMAIIHSLERYRKQKFFLFLDKVIYKKTYNEESLTNKENYKLNKAIPGLVANAILCIKELEQNRIDLETRIDEVNKMMCSMYKFFLQCKGMDTSKLPEHWITIRKYYLEVYSKYEKEPLNAGYLSSISEGKKQILKKYTAQPDLKTFINDLKLCGKCPQKYLNG